jgi:hypothetical protein
MLTMDDLNDSVIEGEMRAKEIVERVFNAFYEPGVKREMDMTWASLPEDAKAAMRNSMPEYTKQLDNRSGKER